MQSIARVSLTVASNQETFLRFSRNSEANASEYRESTEEKQSDHGST